MTEAAIPNDVLDALDHVPEAKTRFSRLPPSHRNEYLKWVLEAKTPVTRARRISGMVERLIRNVGS